MLIDPSDYLVDGFTLWCGDDKHYHTRFGGINIQPYQLFWGFHYRLHFDPFHQEIHEKREDLSQKHLGVNQQHRETTNQTYCAECRITLLFKCTYNNGKVIGIYGCFCAISQHLAIGQNYQPQQLTSNIPIVLCVQWYANDINPFPLSVTYFTMRILLQYIVQIYYLVTVSWCQNYE